MVIDLDQVHVTCCEHQTEHRCLGVRRQVSKILDAWVDGKLEVCQLCGTSYRIYRDGAIIVERHELDRRAGQ